MYRVSTQEILDTDACPPVEVEASLRDLCRINRWFGGVATTRRLIECVASATGRTNFSVLEVAAGFGEVSKIAGRQLEPKGITLEVTDLDRVRTHLLRGNRAVVADAWHFPFRTTASTSSVAACSRIIWSPTELATYANEALRVSRCAVLINDLVRHPLHVALVYAGFPLMRSYVSRVDGLASVRRAYVPDEMRQILSSKAVPASRVEISRHFLFRMGVIAWKETESTSEPPRVPRVELSLDGQPRAAVPT